MTEKSRSKKCVELDNAIVHLEKIVSGRDYSAKLGRADAERELGKLREKRAKLALMK